MIGLTSSSSASTRKGEGTVGCQYLCRETNSFVQTSKVERAQVKQIRTRGVLIGATRPLTWQRPLNAGERYQTTLQLSASR